MRVMNATAARAASHPSIAPPATTLTNSGRGDMPSPDPEAVYAPKKSMKQMMPEPSLSSDSASTKVEKRLLVLSSCNKATTATGSVALMSAPNISAKDQFHCSYPGTIAPMPTSRRPVSPMHRTSPGTASSVALASVLRKTCMSIS